MIPRVPDTYLETWNDLEPSLHKPYFHALCFSSTKNDWKPQPGTTQCCSSKTDLIQRKHLNMKKRKKQIKICENESYLFPNSAHHLAWLGKCTRPCKDCCQLGTQRLEFGMKLLPWWLSSKMNTIRNSLFNSMVHSLNFLKNFTILSNISWLNKYL